MDSTPVIMVVEESDITARVMTNILGKTFDVVNVHSGSACLQQVPDIRPTTIFMDVRLPELSGFDTCRALKDDEATRHIPVIFISEENSVQEKMLGYDAGGDDFLGIPFHPPELLAKAKVSIEHHTSLHALADKVSSLAEQADNASKVAFAAMRSNSDLGAINQFMRTSYAAKDFYELSSLLFQTLQQWGLATSVQFRGCHQVVSLSEAEYVPPLEEELLSVLVNHGRIVEFGSRAVFNFDHVSLLIKNLPDDAEQVGLLRDSIATLMESVEAKVCSLHREYTLRNERDKHLNTLNRIQIGFKQHEQMTMNIMDTLMNDMQALFNTLGLSEVEESQFDALLTTALASLTKLYANGMQIDADFNSALNYLQNKNSRTEKLQRKH